MVSKPTMSTPESLHWQVQQVVNFQTNTKLGCTSDEWHQQGPLANFTMSQERCEIDTLERKNYQGQYQV